MADTLLLSDMAQLFRIKPTPIPSISITLPSSASYSAATCLEKNSRHAGATDLTKGAINTGV
jgi:hypothetical protein